MINEERTLADFDHTSDTLSNGSDKRVWRICEGCGKEDNVRYSHYIGGQTKCNSCAGVSRKVSDATRLKISNSLANRKHLGIPGRPHSDETKKKISDAGKGVNNSNWRGGITNDPYCLKFNEAVKEANREKYGRRCFLCNRPEEWNMDKNGKIRKLSVHHVDMNKQQGCNGHEWKIVPLCMKCHNSKTTEEMEQYIEYILSIEP